MLIDEYVLLMESYNYNRLNHMHDIHLQAYLSHAVTATKKVGKRERSMYPNFKDFFDYDKELQRLEGDSPDNKGDNNIKRSMLNINTKMNDFGGE